MSINLSAKVKYSMEQNVSGWAVKVTKEQQKTEVWSLGPPTEVGTQLTTQTPSPAGFSRSVHGEVSPKLLKERLL